MRTDASIPEAREQSGDMAFLSRSNVVTASTFEHERPAADSRKWFKPVAASVGLFAAVWLSLYAAYVFLPFLRPGAVIITDAKFDTMVAGRMFSPEDRYRVMIFGHSKVLASALPSLLDEVMGPGFRSYNLGIPGEVRMLPILEAALQAGNIPTHVLLTVPWDSKPDSDGLRELLRDDATLAKTLLPFRTLPRDATLFVFENRHRLAQAVHDVGIERDRVLADRGWYFIKSQSQYADDRLPDDYALPTDRPTLIDRRQIPERSFTRSRLEQLATQYGFQILFIPMPFRTGELAPAPKSDEARVMTLSDYPRVRVVGPDYFIYPPAFFADPQHTNRHGAEAYTADLAKLLKTTGVLD